MDELMPLRYLYGPRAAWTSKDQEAVVMDSLRNRSSDALAIMGCGTGKSLSFIYPLIYHASLGFATGMTIVVVPYKSIVSSHLSVYKNEIQKKFPEMKIMGITKSDVAGVLPDFLKNDDNLPNLLIVAIDALTNLNGQHINVIQRWDSNSKIRKIVVDEPHILYTEPFRSAFDEIKRLQMYRTPKLFIDATMPVGILPQFLRAVGINSNAGIVGRTDYPMPDVEISVKEARNSSNDNIFVTEILDNLEEMLRSWTNSNKLLSVHVQCMSKRICDLCSAAAEVRSISPTKAYHANTPNQSRKEISDLWTGGKLKAIFTTYDCGIDCTSCRGVIFAGGAYGVVGLLQGIGRIRPKQQGPEASVLVLNATVDPRWKAEMMRQMSRDAARLRGAGWVESVDQYLSIFGIQAFENWLASDECRMKQLMRLIGIDAEICRRCDHCRGNVPELRQFHAARAAEERRQLLEKHYWELLALLEELCISCNDRKCDGRGFIRNSGLCLDCCRSGHKHTECHFDPKKEFEGKKICNSCFVPESHSGPLDSAHMSSNDGCKHKWRFKRFVMYCGKGRGRDDTYRPGITMRDFIREKFANDETMLEMMIGPKKELYDRFRI